VIAVALGYVHLSLKEARMFRTGLIVLAISAFAAVAAAQDAAAGAKVYVDQKCSVCHSIAGKGNVKGPLDEVGSKPADEIRAWITDAKGMTEKTKAPRKPVMKQYSLPKGDVDALVAYLSTLKK
jgi:mono/diheme cytochrome c family protein